MNKKFTILLSGAITGFILFCIIGLILLYFLDRDIKDIKNTQVKSHVNQMKTNQLLLSSMEWSTKRQKYVLFMRDMIMSEWQRIGEKNIDVSKAYNYSEIIMRNVENFPQIDPSFILSMACVESAFGEGAVSFRGAMGLLQIMPFTARPYFDLYGIPYSDSALHQPVINIKIGIRYMADIMSCYSNVEKSLAVYNGGKWGVYYPDSMLKVPEETKKYVPCVMAKWKEYKSVFENYRIDSLRMKDEFKDEAKTDIKNDTKNNKTLKTRKT